MNFHFHGESCTQNFVIITTAAAEVAEPRPRKTWERGAKLCALFAGAIQLFSTLSDYLLM